MVTTHHYFPDLPEELKGLTELALDVRWSWSHRADILWEQLDPELWGTTKNPWLILQTLSKDELIKLRNNPSFCNTLESLLKENREALVAPTWFQKNHPQAPLTAIAYFSMEFGLSESLPFYSGGLGLLAGDHLKAANDLGVPIVGVGLLYQEGYFRQALNADGEQIALYPSNNPGELPITPVFTKQGERLRLKVSLDDHHIWVRGWQARVGRITLYLLDINDPANTPADRCITSHLYGGGSEQRLQQELLLGIGGWRLLKALEIEPEVCHLNEGHAAFVVLERARMFMEQSELDFAEALAVTRAGNIFTTHTPVAAGFDSFEPELIRQSLCRYAQMLGLDIEQLLNLGRVQENDPDEPFKMAYLAVRGCTSINGVSRLHGIISRRIFAPLFPGWPMDEVPVGYITNGVHVPSWDSKEFAEIWTEACGEDRWICAPEKVAEQIKKVPDSKLWEYRCKGREKLINYARKHLTHQTSVIRHARTPAEASNNILDPNVLTLGFARRFATYKRPNLLLHDPERLVRLLSNTIHPVQLLIAGKAHPHDHKGQALIKAWTVFIARPEIRNSIVFLVDYDMQVAEKMVQGVDVWINTPTRPMEASGTSGMKILVNGGLNLSELDGWWAEAYTPEVGWALGDGEEHIEPGWDAVEANALYTLLEQEVIPAFYTRNEEGIPIQWVKRMRESMAQLTPVYSTGRMVREYTEDYYLSAALAYQQRMAENNALGTQLVNWQQQLKLYWQDIHLGEVNVEKMDNSYRFQVPVYLGEIEAHMVRVELFSEPLKNDEQEQLFEMQQAHRLTGSANGFLYTLDVPANRPIEDFTPRIIPHHPAAKVPIEANQIIWQDKTL